MELLLSWINIQYLSVWVLLFKLELKFQNNPDQFLKIDNMLHSWFFSKKRAVIITSMEDWTKTRQLILSAECINLMDKVDDLQIHPHFLKY